MPSYDFRCKNCGHEFSKFYKSYAAYDAATPTCSHCGHTDLSRIISRVAVKSPSRDYTKMSAGEMLSVFESGDSRQVGQMFEQIGGTSPETAAPIHEATQRLLKGESMDNVEKSLQAHDQASKSDTKSD